MLLSTNLKRISKRGWLIFKRNNWLTIATIVTMFLSIVVFTGVLLMNYTTNKFVGYLKDKVDISVYFKAEIDESEILSIQGQLGKVEGVVKTEYVPKEKALKTFQARFGTNDILMKALNELGENPLSSAINIQIRNPEDYNKVLSYVETSIFKDKLANVNFDENRDLLSKTTSLINSLKIGSIVITFALTGVAIIVAFNTIRIAIYSMKEEINTMKLVGASNWFIRGPFILAGSLYGVISAFLTFVFYIPLILIFGRKLDVFLGTISVTKYFFSNILGLLFSQILFGIVIGVVSAFIAIAKYLKEAKQVE